MRFWVQPYKNTFEKGQKSSYHFAHFTLCTVGLEFQMILQSLQNLPLGHQVAINLTQLLIPAQEDSCNQSNSAANSAADFNKVGQKKL